MKFNSVIPTHSFKLKQTLDSRVSHLKKDLPKQDNKQDNIFEQSNNCVFDLLPLKQENNNQGDVNSSFPFKNNQIHRIKLQKSIVKHKQKTKKNSICFSPLEPAPNLLFSPQSTPLSFNHSLTCNNFSNINNQDINNLNSLKATTINTIKLTELNAHKKNEFSQILQKFQISKNIDIYSKIKKYLFGFRNKKVKQITDHLKKIETQIDEEFDIFRIYKDILFLKKAVFILLGQDQLAALQIVGCKSNLLEKETGHDLSYYEKQLAISISDELQYEHLHKFLDRCQVNKLNLDKIDKRILESIQGCHLITS
ncbi:hypothetical protein ABPG73_002002 [Tetrahymena malaccensis]